jgi:hypothetical protein
MATTSDNGNAQAPASVNRRFLGFLTDLLLCSRCLRAGVRRPVPQAISPRHRPLALCGDCRERDRSSH